MKNTKCGSLPDYCFGPQVTLLELICDYLGINDEELMPLLKGTEPFSDKVCEYLGSPQISERTWKNLEKNYRKALERGAKDLSHEYIDGR